jgi:hypothetical protein
METRTILQHNTLTTGNARTARTSNQINTITQSTHHCSWNNQDGVHDIQPRYLQGRPVR